MAQTVDPSPVLRDPPRDTAVSHRLWVGGPVPPGADAWTLGSLIIVRRRHAASTHLLQHELQHVEQYRVQGFFGFLHRYLSDYLALRLRGFGHDVAYRRIPAEITAEWRTRRKLGIGVVPAGARVG